MITKNFQKLGALVASLASILTLSSAAEAITFTSAAGGTIGRATATSTAAVGSPATRSYQLIPAPTDPRKIADFNFITIKNLVFPNKANLKGSLVYTTNSPEAITTTRTFTLFDRNGTTGALNGDYTFVSNGGLNWATASNAVGSSAVAGGVYTSVDDFFSLGDPVNDPSFINASWTLQLQNYVTTYTPQGTFSNFSIDVAAVPFESNAAPAGVAIVFGAFVLRRKLQQRSAQKMSLESVNS